MQSELTEIEHELLATEKKDSAENEVPKRLRSMDYYWIRHYEKAEDKDSTHYDLVMKIREKLGEYNKFILASVHHPSHLP